MRNELEGIKLADVKSPDQEVGDNEEVIGTLTDTDLQKLRVLSVRLDRQIETLTKEHAHKAIDMMGAEDGPDHNKETCEVCTMARNHAVLGDKKDAVNALFWTGLRHELPEEALMKLQKAGGTVGIRKDWKIVACHEGRRSLREALLAFGLPIPVSI